MRRIQSSYLNIRMSTLDRSCLCKLQNKIHRSHLSIHMSKICHSRQNIHLSTPNHNQFQSLFRQL